MIKEDKNKGTENYLKKLRDATHNYLNELNKPTILEFGVRHGFSTRLFLDYCEKNQGKLYSVDIDDCSKASNSSHWEFIQSRDDNFEFLLTKLPKEFDLIFIDSYHNAEHVKKIFYYYYSFLKKNGLMLIDDINWIIYSKDKVKNNFNSEINNNELFFTLLEILNNNYDNINIKFDFRGSGIAQILKIENKINPSKKIISRKLSIKNFLRKIIGAIN